MLGLLSMDVFTIVANYYRNFERPMYDTRFSYPKVATS